MIERWSSKWKLSCDVDMANHLGVSHAGNFSTFGIAWVCKYLNSHGFRHADVSAAVCLQLLCDAIFILKSRVGSSSDDEKCSKFPN